MEIFDVTGSYLNSDMPEDKLILLNNEGGFVEIICEVNPNTKKCACGECSKGTINITY